MDLPGDSAADVSRFSCENAPRMQRRTRLLLATGAITFAVLVGLLVLPTLLAPDLEGLDACVRCVELARLAPAGADEVAIAPSGGSLWFAMVRHPIREDRIFGGTLRGTVIALAVGRNPVVTWKQGDRSGAAVSAPASRRALLRLVVPPPLRGQVSTKAGALVIGNAAGGFPIEEYASLAQAAGQLFVAHQRRPSIPGVLVPALSAVTLEKNSLAIISHSRDASVAATPLPPALRHPSGAALSVALGSVTAVAGDWERLLPVDSTGMGAGLVAIYGVDSGAFLPRVRGVVVAESRETDPVALLDRLVPSVDGSVSSIRHAGGVVIAKREAMGLVGEAALVDGHAVLAFDGSSMDKFLADRAAATPFASGAEWSLRARPTELRLAIRRGSESLGYKLLSKRTRNSVRGLSRSLGWVEGARWATFERTRNGGEASVTCRVEW